MNLKGFLMRPTLLGTLLDLSDGGEEEDRIRLGRPHPAWIREFGGAQSLQKSLHLKEPGPVEPLS